MRHEVAAIHPGSAIFTALFRIGKKHVLRAHYPVTTYVVDLTQTGWKTLKPVCNPGVQRIPPNPGDGSAGQLFWRPQQHPEMRRNISPLESKLIERATGDRTIAQIVAELERELERGISDEEVFTFYRDMQDLEYVWFTSASL